MVVSVRGAGFLHPSWSPDGHQLVFGLAGSTNGLFVVSRAGGRLRRLTAGHDRDAVWSPDGGFIAFVRSEPGSGESVYIVSPAGAGLRKLAPSASEYGDLAWASTSRYLAMTVWPTGRTAVGGGGCPEVEVVSVAGVSRVVSDGGCASSATWSPSGRQLAYVLMQQSSQRVVIASATGSQAAYPITPGPDDADPSWSPDGRLIAFSRSRGSGRVLATVSAHGGSPRNLTRVPGLADAPVGWAPDGRWILFERFDPVEDFSVARLFVTSRDGSRKQKIGAEIELGTATWGPR